MRSRILIRALLTAAVIALPAVALAQPNPGTHSANGWNNGSPSGQWQGNGQAQHSNRRDRDDRSNRNANQYPNNGSGNNGYGNNGYGNNGYSNNGYSNGQLSGVVSSFSAFSLNLSNGPHINLHQGTIINPTGTTLRPGMNVAVLGHSNQDGSFEADQINVMGNVNGNYNGYGMTGGGVSNVLGPMGSGVSNVLGTLLGRLGL
jgi:hypothetical protein